MKKFRFKLEAVHRIRKSKEQEALRALAEAQRGLRAEVEAREALVAAMNESLQRRESLGNVPVTPAAFSLETDFIVGSKVRIAHAELAVRRAQRRLEKAMQEYLVAKRGTKTIDRLRERALEKFKREKEKHEQKQLDDLYTMRARLAAEGESDEEFPQQQVRQTEEAAG